MAIFELSAFSDEYSSVFDKQIEGLKLNGIKHMEIRGVDGKNISDITLEEAAELKQKLDSNGITVSSMGSPIGKIKITDPFEPHLESLKHIIKLAKVFECDRIRMFSFYIPGDEDPALYKDKVMERLAAMLAVAKSENIILCHENEKGIYGDTAERCLEIQKEFNGEIKLIFDHANFICCDVEAYPFAFDLLKDYIYYMHIKDATADKRIMPAGKGIGHIPESIDALKKYDKKFILTVEPHLQIFKGLSNIEQAEGKHHLKIEDKYSTNEEAFTAAVNAIKQYII
jgi:sugar phosphate isomerase/epimerase